MQSVVELSREFMEEIPKLMKSMPAAIETINTLCVDARYPVGSDERAVLVAMRNIEELRDMLYSWRNRNPDDWWFAKTKEGRAHSVGSLWLYRDELLPFAEVGNLIFGESKSYEARLQWVHQKIYPGRGKPIFKLYWDWRAEKKYPKRILKREVLEFIKKDGRRDYKRTGSSNLVL